MKGVYGEEVWRAGTAGSTRRQLAGWGVGWHITICCIYGIFSHVPISAREDCRMYSFQYVLASTLDIVSCDK